jgi:hypothetical protein
MVELDPLEAHSRRVRIAQARAEVTELRNRIGQLEDVLREVLTTKPSVEFDLAIAKAWRALGNKLVRKAEESKPEEAAGAPEPGAQCDPLAAKREAYEECAKMADEVAEREGSDGYMVALTVAEKIREAKERL